MPADTTPFDPSQIPVKASSPKVQWEYLAKGIDYIMAHPEGLKGLGVASANLYAVVFNWTSSRPQPPSKSLYESTYAKYQQMQEHLTQYFRRLYPAFQSLTGTELLAYYAEQFDLAKSSAAILNRVFEYFNRVVRNRGEAVGKNRQYTHPTGRPAYSAVMHAWKASILDPLQADGLKVTSGLLDMIHANRTGNQIDVALVKGVIESLLFLGEQLVPVPDARQRIYKENFEVAYLADFEEYCKRTVGGHSLQEGEDGDEYRKMVESLLKQESEKIGVCLPARTETKGASLVRSNVLDNA